MSDEGPWKYFPGDEIAESQFKKLREENGEEQKNEEEKVEEIETNEKAVTQVQSEAQQVIEEAKQLQDEVEAEEKKMQELEASLKSFLPDSMFPKSHPEASAPKVLPNEQELQAKLA